MAVRPNSPATKDIAYVMHPYTNPSAHEDSGPQIIQRGDGIYVYDDDGKKFIEGLAGLWYASLGFSEERLVKAAAAQMTELPVYHAFSHRSTGPAIEPRRADHRERSGAHVEDLFHLLGVGGGGYRDQDRLVLPQRDRQAGKEEDHLAAQRLSRRHRGVVQPHRTQGGAGGLRRAHSQPHADGLPTLLPLRRGRGVGRGVRHAHGGQSREPDPGGGAGDRRGVHSRTRDGRRRRYSAARDLLRQGAAAPEEVRHPLHRGRSDLRIRPHRQHVGIADLRSEPRHGHHGQGDLVGIPAHRRGDVQREDLSGPAPTELRDRTVRTRLHLYGTSRLRGRRPGDTEDLRGA